MNLRDKRKSRADAGMPARRVVKAEAALVGGLLLALFLREIPSLVREARIWRMTGGLRAGHRYP
ncbi:hypothetical protein [Streptomyces tropicalis]|uniref:Uncharacterized protein n=1 Tax=Streptomyces tropicalis TaxID=3034234 RepID=A0ABT6A330_9ACTN|nr:hypothetical protein [Streptomyces tropicalis]MDF3299050.1 hypothetical protein [Streptomyces tropicalis]